MTHGEFISIPSSQKYLLIRLSSIHHTILKQRKIYKSQLKTYAGKISSTILHWKYFHYQKYNVPPCLNFQCTYKALYRCYIQWMPQVQWKYSLHFFHCTSSELWHQIFQNPNQGFDLGKIKEACTAKSQQYFCFTVSNWFQPTYLLQSNAHIPLKIRKPIIM